MILKILWNEVRRDAGSRVDKLKDKHKGAFKIVAIELIDG